MATPLTVAEKMVLDIDQILPMIGEFGKYQMLLELMLCITVIPQTLQVLIMFFAAQNPGWMCVANSTICRLNGTITTDDDHYKDRCSMPRSEWMFSKPKDFSIVTEFDLQCGREPFIQLSSSILFIGWGIGAIILGWLADSYGRKKVVFPSMAFIIVVGFISVWLPNIELFIVSRFIVGFFTPGTGVQMFVMISEFVGPKRRALAGIILWSFFTLGLVILGVKAYFIRKWKTLFIVCTAPYFFVLLFYKFIPESIRWLYVHGRSEEVMKILKKVARVNKKEFPDVTLTPLPKELGVEKRKASPVDLFRPKKMAISSLIQSFGWLVNGMVYYGVALAADDLGGNMYRNYILASLVEFPAIICAIDFCNRFGRKKTVAYPMFVGAVACVVVSLIPSGTSITHWNALRVVLGMIGKFCITVSFDAIYTWSVELYPTTVRAEGMGLLQIASRAGAASAPWVAKSLKVVHIILPFSLMGGITFASAIFLLFLPETRGMATRETLSNDDEEKEEKKPLEYPESKDEDKLITPKEGNGNLATFV